MSTSSEPSSFSKLTSEGEAILVRAKRALVSDHLDLVEGVAELDRLRRSAERNDPGSIMLLTGDSGSGKTTIMRRFIHEEQVRILRETGRSAKVGYDGLILTDGGSGDERPVVFVNTPSSRSQTALASAILKAYGAEVPRQLRKHQILNRLRAQIVGQQTRVLILDEFHHCVDEKRDQVVIELSELVKDILVDTRVHIVIAGMGHAALPVDRNPQLNRRCVIRFPLGPFGWGESVADRKPFCDFLNRLEASMALPEKSDLADPVRAGCIHRATGGLIGFVTRLVHQALERGLEIGLQHVDDRHLAFAYDQTKVTGDRTNPFRDCVGLSRGRSTSRRSRSEAKARCQTAGAAAKPVRSKPGEPARKSAKRA